MADRAVSVRAPEVAAGNRERSADFGVEPMKSPAGIWVDPGHGRSIDAGDPERARAERGDERAAREWRDCDHTIVARVEARETVAACKATALRPGTDRKGLDRGRTAHASRRAGRFLGQSGSLPSHRGSQRRRGRGLGGSPRSRAHRRRRPSFRTSRRGAASARPDRSAARRCAQSSTTRSPPRHPLLRP